MLSNHISTSKAWRSSNGEMLLAYFVPYSGWTILFNHPFLCMNDLFYGSHRSQHLKKSVYTVLLQGCSLEHSITWLKKITYQMLNIWAAQFFKTCGSKRLQGPLNGNFEIIHYYIMLYYGLVWVWHAMVYQCITLRCSVSYIYYQGLKLETHTIVWNVVFKPIIHENSKTLVGLKLTTFRLHCRCSNRWAMDMWHYFMINQSCSVEICIIATNVYAYCKTQI